MRIFLLGCIFLMLNIATVFAAPSVISENIKIDQLGYRPNDPKVAVISKSQTGAGAPSTYTPGTVFKIRRWSDDVEVFSANITAWNGGVTHTQSGDKVWWFDFSTFGVVGEYYVYDVTNNVGSFKFSINSNVYNDAIKAATKAFFYQRCGTVISATHGGAWTHATCHNGIGQDLDCHLISDPNNAATAKSLSGGWHDAGDYNKYVNFTYNPMHQLLFAYQENPTAFTDDLNIPESGNNVPDLLDEIKYELDWLIKMQQSNGSVLSKVSVTAYQGTSPPNSDNAARYYGAASTSSTLTVASIFAHAYIIFKDIPLYATYATTLRTKAVQAWTWAQSNPNVTFSNTGFSSANPEVSSYLLGARKTTAALMLHIATTDVTYRTYFESNYASLHPIQWTYFYPFEKTESDILLYSTVVSTITQAVKDDIRAKFQASVNNHPDFYPNVTNSTDAYRAYVKDADYVWGSNEGKSWLGVMYGQMVRYGLSFSNHASYKMAALDYLHYLHGVNPLSYMMLSNTASIGSDKPVTEIYHLWTGDGTSFDTNPIPGLVSGGMNSNYSGTNTYFSGQPIQKKYLNFNTSFPENSWELSEPAIYYQAAYLRLAATALPGNVVLPLSLLRFTGSDNKKTRQNKLDWQTTAEVNVAHFAIERSENSVLFQEIGRVSAKGQSSANINNYTFTDNNRSENAQYYRLKIIDKDNTVAYSATIFIDNKGKQLISVFPNPGQNELNLVVDEKYTSETIFMYNAIGVLVKTWTIFKSNLDVSELPAGTYFIRIGDQTINWKKGSH